MDIQSIISCGTLCLLFSNHRRIHKYFRFLRGFSLLRLSSFLYCVGVLIVCLCHTFPLSTQFEQQEEIGEIDSATPPFFEHANNRHGFLYREDIDAGFEVLAGCDGIDIVIELLDGAMLQSSVEDTEQDGIVGEQFFA